MFLHAQGNHMVFFFFAVEAAAHMGKNAFPRLSVSVRIVPNFFPFGSFQMLRKWLVGSRLMIPIFSDEGNFRFAECIDRPNMGYWSHAYPWEHYKRLLLSERLKGSPKPTFHANCPCRRPSRTDGVGQDWSAAINRLLFD